MSKIAVILAGCGRADGSEVHESTLALYFIARGGAEYQCFGLEESQVRVVDHLSGEPTGETRSQIAEAARIARGDIRPLPALRAADFDGLAIPGGSGGFENLSQGPGDVHPELRRVVTEFADAGKPVAAICIAPMLVARILGDRGVSVTIGNDAETAAEIEATGAKHVERRVHECYADEAHHVVSTAAYMLGPSIADVGAGIEACIGQLLDWCV